MTWTKRKPRKGGWYWWKCGRYIQMVYLEDYLDADAYDARGEWCGPLMPPKPLEDEAT